jgi:hypothetical protein
MKMIEQQMNTAGQASTEALESGGVKVTHGRCHGVQDKKNHSLPAGYIGAARKQLPTLDANMGSVP